MEDAGSVGPFVGPPPLELIEAFRSRYNNLERAVVASVTHEFGDCVVLARIGDDLDEYSNRFQQVSSPIA